MWALCAAINQKFLNIFLRRKWYSCASLQQEVWAGRKTGCVVAMATTSSLGNCRFVGSGSEDQRPDKFGSLDMCVRGREEEGVI